MFRLCDYTGFSRIEAAHGYSAELLSIAETVLDGNDYSDAFTEAIESPVGDLLILDRAYLAVTPPWSTATCCVSAARNWPFLARSTAARAGHDVLREDERCVALEGKRS